MFVKEIKAGARDLKANYKSSDRKLSLIVTAWALGFAIIANIFSKISNSFSGYVSFQYIVISALVGLISVLLGIFSSLSFELLSYGFVQTLHKQTLGYKQDASSLFLPFKNEFVPILKIVLFEGLLLTGLLIVPVFILCCLIVLKTKSVEYGYADSSLSAYISFVLLVIFVISVVFRYVFYLVSYLRIIKYHNGEKVGTVELFKLSRKLMKGNKFLAFKLDFSFLLFDILNLFCLGLLEIFFLRQYKTYSYLILAKEICDKNGIYVSDEQNKIIPLTKEDDI